MFLDPSVPMLDPSGENWVIFSFRFKLAVRAKGLWGHFDGTSVRPEACPASLDPTSPYERRNLGIASYWSRQTPAPTHSSGHISPNTPSQPIETPLETLAAHSTPCAQQGGYIRSSSPTSAEVSSLASPSVNLPSADEVKKIQREWDNNEAVSRTLLSQNIPDSTFLRIRKCPTVAERWNAVVVEYTDKAYYAQSALEPEFLRSKCPKGANVRLYLEELRYKKEILVLSGVEINDDKFRATIIGSLPRELTRRVSASFTAVQLASPSIAALTGVDLPVAAIQPMRSINPNVLINLISSLQK